MKAYMIADLLATMEREYLAQGFQAHAEAIHDALGILRRAGHEDDDPISEPARGQLFPLMEQANVGLEDLKVHLRASYGIHSTKAIPWGVYEDVCQWLIGQRTERRERRRVRKRPRRAEPLTNVVLSEEKQSKAS